MSLFQKLSCCMLLLGLVSLTACGGGEDSKDDKKEGDGKTSQKDDSSGSGTYASPDDVFAAFKKAGAASDVKGLMECMTPDSQNQMVMATVMMAAFLPMNHLDDEEKADAITEQMKSIMEKHGLKEEDQAEQSADEAADLEKYLAPVKDRQGLAADLFALVQKEDPSMNMFTGLGNAELKDVKVDGDQAAGKFTMDGKEEDIEFVKVDGSWLIKMPEPSGPPVGGDDLPDLDLDGGAGDDDGSDGQ